MTTAITPNNDPINSGSGVPRLPALGRFLFTADEVAEALAVSTTRVRQLTLCGDIPCRRIGRLVRYSPEDVEAFVADMDRSGYRPSKRQQQGSTQRHPGR